MEDKNKAELELEFIKNIISDSRRKVNDSGLSGVIWGSLVVIGIMVNYFSGIYHNWDYALYIWGILLAAGWTYTFLKTRNVKKNNRPETFALKIQNAVWRASGIIMTIIALVCSIQFKREVSDLVPYSYIINSMAIAPIISLILGAAYYVTGYINECKFTSRLAYGWWTGGIILFYMKSYNTFLVFALMTILFQILPGIRFYRRSKES
ncbi:MAG: hypothetical protein JXR69_01465 [Candidatus Delongbacteria bacterium]|nr:hypothetical protein [Candidatus Delongbacteria bacterium]